MKLRAVVMLLSLLALLSCGTPPREQALVCGPSPAGFLSESQFVQYHASGLIGNSLRLRSGDELEWNGRPVSLAETDSLLEQTAKMEPRPHMQFEWEEQTSCDSVHAIRALVDKHLKCANESFCIEKPASSHFPHAPK